MTTEEERAKDLKVFMQAIADISFATEAVDWDKLNEREKMSETNFTGGDRVHHPKYYMIKGLPECIEVIRGLGLSYELGSALKYIWRTGRKTQGPEAVIDLQKARFYLEKEIERQVRILRPKPTERVAVEDEEEQAVHRMCDEGSPVSGWGVPPVLRQEGTEIEGVDARVTREEAIREFDKVHTQRYPIESYYSSSTRPMDD